MKYQQSTDSKISSDESCQPENTNQLGSKRGGSADYATAIMNGLRAVNESSQPNIDSAREWMKIAKLKGATDFLLVKQILTDCYQHLAKSALLLKKYQEFQNLLQESNYLKHGENAIDNKFEKELAYIVQLGLLNEAPELLQEKLKEIKNLGKENPVYEAKAKVFETEIALLRHELQIAQTRGQLKPSADKMLYSRDNSSDDAEATSQLGQDIWVLEKTNHKKGGFFVEFGATDGIILSNTYLLEKKYEWNGICAEPNPKFFSQLQKNRRCTVSNECVSGTSGEEVEFVFADVFGGMRIDMASDAHHEKRQAYLKTGQTKKIKTISLHDLLIKHNAPKKIDYLSIDTEGSEFRIINSFPFDKWDVKLITIEHNYSKEREKIHELLKTKGYFKIEREWEDWYKKLD